MSDLDDASSFIHARRMAATNESLQASLEQKAEQLGNEITDLSIERAKLCIASQLVGTSEHEIDVTVDNVSLSNADEIEVRRWIEEQGYAVDGCQSAYDDTPSLTWSLRVVDD